MSETIFDIFIKTYNDPTSKKSASVYDEYLESGELSIPEIEKKLQEAGELKIDTDKILEWLSGSTEGMSETFKTLAGTLALPIIASLIGWGLSDDDKKNQLKLPMAIGLITLLGQEAIKHFQGQPSMFEGLLPSKGLSDFVQEHPRTLILGGIPVGAKMFGRPLGIRPTLLQTGLASGALGTLGYILDERANSWF